MADPIPVVRCPWCGGSDCERRGDHWCCGNVNCLAFWQALNANDRKWLKSLHIQPDDEGTDS